SAVKDCRLSLKIHLRDENGLSTTTDVTGAYLKILKFLNEGTFTPSCEKSTSLPNKRSVIQHIVLNPGLLAKTD
ncbi:hypothetical protein K8353_47385, partial [Burkholderia contaminans]|nr:hypothetical protein [Burkholderia contaminans]